MILDRLVTGNLFIPDYLTVDCIPRLGILIDLEENIVNVELDIWTFPHDKLASFSKIGFLFVCP